MERVIVYAVVNTSCVSLGDGTGAIESDNNIQGIAHSAEEMVVPMSMKNAWQKRVAVLCMLMVISLYPMGMAPMAEARGETGNQAVVSEQYPLSTDVQKSTSPAPVNTAEETTGKPPATSTANAASPTPAATEPEPSPSPAPSDTASPEPTTSAEATPVPNTPEPAETSLPTADAAAEADTPVTPEALSVCSLYMEGNHAVISGKTVTLKLVLAVDNASGQPLMPFGIRIQTSPYTLCKVKAINQSDAVRFVNQTLLVDGADAQSGHVSIAGESLKLTLSLEPFPEGSEHTSMRVSLALLDSRGNEVNIEEVDQKNARIDLSFTYQLREQPEPVLDAEESEAPLATDTPVDVTETPTVSVEGDKPEPEHIEETPGDSIAAPDEEADQGLQDNGDETQSASDGLPAVTEALATPTPEPPTENRQLQLLASIPYDQLKVGDTLTLQAQRIGYDELNLTMHIQWQQHTHGQWENIEGANGDTLTVAITPDNLRSAWRYSITIEQ